MRDDLKIKVKYFQELLRTEDLETMKRFLLEHRNQKGFDQIFKNLETVVLRMIENIETFIGALSPESSVS